MGIFKDRMIVLDELIAIAIENGAQTLDDVLGYVMPINDDDYRYIKEQLRLMFGEVEMT